MKKQTTGTTRRARWPSVYKAVCGNTRKIYSRQNAHIFIHLLHCRLPFIRKNFQKLAIFRDTLPNIHFPFLKKENVKKHAKTAHSRMERENLAYELAGYSGLKVAHIFHELAERAPASPWDIHRMSQDQPLRALGKYLATEIVVGKNQIKLEHRVVQAVHGQVLSVRRNVKIESFHVHDFFDKARDNIRYWPHWPSLPQVPRFSFFDDFTLY
jgi:hypothetical protein